MSVLIKGKLHEGLGIETTDGRFVRRDSQFRNWITADGTPGPSGEGGFSAEPGRYHLYVSYACPWAHRTLIFRRLKALEDIISVSVVNPLMGPKGWDFRPWPGTTEDTANGFLYLHQVYTLAQGDYSGLVTVPLLWDRQRRTIVNNESAEIIRMFNSAFDALTGSQVDFYPAALRTEIDALNRFIYANINDGVYRCGFATSQEAYEEAVEHLFQALDELEQRLAARRYLCGDRITEADWRLFTTLVRFDAVYYSHFKTNLRRLADYPHLYAYTRDLYQQPGIAETLNLDHIKQHYFRSHPQLNPSGIVPAGPHTDFSAPHQRAR